MTVLKISKIARNAIIANIKRLEAKYGIDVVRSVVNKHYADVRIMRKNLAEIAKAKTLIMELEKTVRP